VEESVMRRTVQRRAAWLVLIVVSLSLPAAVVAAGNGSAIAQIHAGTAQFHDNVSADELEVGLAAAGYGPLHMCTDHEGGLGAMGQHYVNPSLLGDATFDLSRPEVLVYEPRPNGKMRLVAVEFVELVQAWPESSPPQLFGRELTLVPEPNRYGVPAFYETHVWLWKHNPSGMFSDWNPNVSCLGMGDPQ
jgi:hypothetical protein